MVIKSKINQHSFSYLSDHSGRRLDPTLAPNSRRRVHADDSVSTWVAELMTKNVISLSPNDSVQKAIKIFKQKEIHHIPLLYQNTLVGMISDRDIMWLNFIDLDEKTTIKKFMNNIIVVCHQDTPLDHLAHVFYREKINGMPVINDQNHFVGIVTHHDLLRWIYDVD